MKIGDLPVQRRRRFIDASPPVAIVLGATVAFTAAVMAGDYLTGPYLVFAAFYLVPVVAAAWFLGRDYGLLLGVLAAVAGAVSTAIDPREVTVPVIVWNALFRFATYALVAVLVSSERRALREVERLAATDPLTQLLNRRRLYELIADELESQSGGGRPFSVIYIDVDDLKVRNDTIGHEAGDAMLVDFARIARATMRETDAIARVGGDEFCVLAPSTTLAEAEEAVRRLSANLADVDGSPIRVSMGVVSGISESHAMPSVEAIIRAADQLMLQAKRAGKGQFRSRAGFDAGPWIDEGA